MLPEDNPEQDVEITKDEDARDDVQIIPPPLPKYKCHKVVGALKIANVSPTPNGGAIIVPTNTRFSSIGVDENYINSHMPHVGGYYVRYADGYESFSPAKAFEDGYDLMP